MVSSSGSLFRGIVNGRGSIICNSLDVSGLDQVQWWTVFGLKSFYSEFAKWEELRFSEFFKKMFVDAGGLLKALIVVEGYVVGHSRG